MNELLNSLLLWATTLTGYQHPLELPRVIALDPAEITAILCDGKLCTAVAYYDENTKTIYYENRIDLKKEHGGRSFIVHEMVHYIQDKMGKLSDASHRCESRIELEREAYRVQRYFLVEHDQDVLQIDLAIAVLDSVCIEE
jgi:hypothetical protein